MKSIFFMTSCCWQIKVNVKKIIVIIVMLLSAFELKAQDDYQPVLEHRADRVVIFPQRIENLDDDVSVMDVLLMYPETLVRSYDEIIDRYQIRVENLNQEADMRIFLTTLKAKYVEKIQVCDNPDVMKGSKNLGGVIDINLVRGLEEKDIYVGFEADTKGILHFPAFNAVYGNGKTDVLVSASLEDKSKHGDYNALARYHAKVNQALNENHNFMYDVMGHYSHSNLDGNNDSRFHGTQFQYDGIFNDKGTMLTVDLGYEYYDDGFSSPSTTMLKNGERNREFWQIYIVELNTPLADGLDLCVGWEGDYANTKLKHSQQLALTSGEKQSIENAFNLKTLPTDFSVKDKIKTGNNDAYIQFDYCVGPLSLTIGDRIMFYRYGYKNDINNSDESRKSPYNLVVASAILSPNPHHQIQGAYFRRFVTPDSYDVHNYLHFDTDGRSVITGNQNLDYQPADLYRFGYTFSKPKILASLIASYTDTHNAVVDIETLYHGIPVASWDNDNSSCGITNIDASATLISGKFLLTGGASFYNKHFGGDNFNYGYFRLAPSLRLSGRWRIDCQTVYCTKNTLEKLATDTDVFATLSLQKTFGEHLTISAQWHDIFCKDLSAGNFRILYYF